MLFLDLRVPPGNRLEKLKGNRAGQHSTRVNDHWRICFRWKSVTPTTSRSWTITGGTLMNLLILVFVGPAPHLRTADSLSAS